MQRVIRTILKEVWYHTLGRYFYKLRRFLFYVIFLAGIVILNLFLTSCGKDIVADAPTLTDAIEEGLITEEEVLSKTTTSKEVMYDIKDDSTEQEEVSTENINSTEEVNEVSYVAGQYEIVEHTKDNMKIPSYEGILDVVINNNIPTLNKEDGENGIFIHISDFDELGRCGTTYSCLGKETLATEDRAPISSIHPSGWHTVKYPEIISDLYLYNRGHLQMFFASGISDEPRNLITMTRQCNADKSHGMLCYESKLVDYIQHTGNHVLYKVSPVYANESDLVAVGVHMEALSVEDDELSFNVFIFNKQDGIEIDYATGDSWLAEENKNTEVAEETETSQELYILNKNSKKIHKVGGCEALNTMKPKNKKEYTGNIEELINNGYSKCKNCFN